MFPIVHVSVFISLVSLASWSERSVSGAAPSGLATAETLDVQQRLFRDLWPFTSDSQPDGDHYVTPCEQELGSQETGRYPTLISQQFLPDVIQIEGPQKNMNCVCNSDIRMTCTITVRSQSFQHIVVRRRIGDPIFCPRQEDLSPFFCVPESVDMQGQVFLNNIFFKHTLCYPPVVARIDVQLLYIKPTLKRYQSAPSRWHYQEHFPIHQSLCTDGADEGVCPITQEPFTEFTVVYILRIDRAKVEEKRKVVCISASGLRHLASQREDKKFRDPLNRENGELLTISSYYDSYVIFEDDPSRCDRAIQTDPKHMQPKGRPTPGRVLRKGISEPSMPTFADLAAGAPVRRKRTDLISPSRDFQPSFTGIEKGSQTHESKISDQVLGTFDAGLYILLFCLLMILTTLSTYLFTHDNSSGYRAIS